MQTAAALCALRHRKCCSGRRGTRAPLRDRAAEETTRGTVSSHVASSWEWGSQAGAAAAEGKQRSCCEWEEQIRAQGGHRTLE